MRIMAQLIDPEELPFTTDELYRAGLRFLPEAKARLMADHMSEVGPIMIADRAARRAGWQRGGVPNADTLPLYGWVYPPELLTALSALSPDVDARVQALQALLEAGRRGPAA